MPHMNIKVRIQIKVKKSSVFNLREDLSFLEVNFFDENMQKSIFSKKFNATYNQNEFNFRKSNANKIPLWLI